MKASDNSGAYFTFKNRLREVNHLAKITSTLEIHLDLTKPVAELAQVISAVLMSSPPEHRKKILEGLDIEVGNALVRLQKEENAHQPEETKEEK